MHSEILKNAILVPTVLGGGARSHLGIAVFPKEFGQVLDTPYKLPEEPPELDISGTQYKIAQKGHKYDKKLCLFREIQGVERALIQQIVSTIEPKFLQALRNPITSKINKTIPQIFKYLFDTFGHISPRELADLKTKDQYMVFNLREQVHTIFTKINDLANISIITTSPMTEQQKSSLSSLF